MNKDRAKASDVIDVLGDQFLLLVRNLVKGNMKRGLGLADEARAGVQGTGLNMASQSLIEEMAQTQAVKNAFLNSPSIVPGVGTILSFWLLSLENFLLLDQSVTLIIALRFLHGAPMDDLQDIERFSVMILGDVFGISSIEKKQDFREISREYMTKTLPLKYANTGLTKGMSRILRRLLPFRSRFRLLPAGFGLIASAMNAYDVIVDAGQKTLKHLPRIGPEHTPREE